MTQKCMNKTEEIKHKYMIRLKKIKRVKWKKFTNKAKEMTQKCTEEIK